LILSSLGWPYGLVSGDGQLQERNASTLILRFTLQISWRPDRTQGFAAPHDSSLPPPHRHVPEWASALFASLIDNTPLLDVIRIASPETAPYERDSPRSWLLEALM
jgi:hypothetical protein